MADATAIAATIFQAIPLDPATGQPNGAAIYDALMSKIEPELVSTVLPTLKEKYKKEPKKNAKARAKRYQLAFQKYDEAYKEYLQQVHMSIHSFQHTALESLESDSRKQEAAELQSLDSAIPSL